MVAKKKTASKKAKSSSKASDKPSKKKIVSKKAEPKAKTITKKVSVKAKTATKKIASNKVEPKATTVAKKAVAKKAVAKKTVAKKTVAKKTVAKKTATKKTATKKTATKKVVSKKAEPKTKVPAKKRVTKSAKENKIVKSNVKYSDSDLVIFKDRIDEVRKDAMEELRMLKERLDDLTSYNFAEESMIYSMHMAEQGSEAMEKEKTYAQIQRINEYIKKLDGALERIKKKTYGICRMCGCLIAKARLLAVPITTLSASYKIQKRCPDDGIDRIEPLNQN